MRKIRYSATATPISFQHWNEKATELGFTLSQFIESVTTLFTLNQMLSISQIELEAFWNGIPRNTNTNFTNDFLSKLKNLQNNTGFSVLKLFYSLLINGFTFSTVGQANIYKNGIFKFYLAVDRFRNQDIDQYFSNNHYNYATLGITSAPNNEYLYISKMQNFKNPNCVNNNFARICSLLGVNPATELIKIHYSELPKLTNILPLI